MVDRVQVVRRKGLKPHTNVGELEARGAEGKAVREADSKRGGETTVELSRAPFRGLLDRVMRSAPSDEALEALAERAPDRWIRVVGELAKLAGFDPRLVNARRGNQSEAVIAEMSDAELQQLVKAMRAD